MDGSFASPATVDAHAAKVVAAYPALKALILRKTGNRAIAEDIVNDAIVTSLEKLKGGQIGNPSLLSGYVYRVALNHLRNFRRKEKGTFADSEKVARIADSTVSTDNVLDLQQRQLAKLVRELLGELPAARDREIIVRLYLYEDSKEDICESLGLSSENFDRVISRARQRFKELLDRRGLSPQDLIAILLAMSLAAASDRLGAVGGLSV